MSLAIIYIYINAYGICMETCMDTSRFGRLFVNILRPSLTKELSFTFDTIIYQYAVYIRNNKYCQYLKIIIFLFSLPVEWTELFGSSKKDRIHQSWGWITVCSYRQGSQFSERMCNISTNDF